MIKKLNRNSIKRLCVNQVISNLASCLKELLENSIDAKATNIEILLKEQGLKEIIIKDNGIGINQADLDLLGQRGVTSKIRQFKDIENLKSFGFRGEALYAICGLGDVQLLTKTEGNELGWEIKLDRNG